MKNSAFLLLLAISVVFTSCKEDDPEPLKAETQAVLLAGEKGSSKTWKLVSGSQQVNAASEVQITFDPCQLDDLFKFTNNDAQDYEMRGGTIKCDDTDPDLLEEGTWAFTLDGSMVVILSNRTAISGLFNFYALPFPAEVLALSDTSMSLRLVIIDDGNTIIFKFNFAKA